MKSGFTLIELLVVISVIGLLAAMLMPALGVVKRQSQSTVCMSQLRQVGMAGEAYSTDWSGNIAVMWQGNAMQGIEDARIGLTGRIHARLWPYITGATVNPSHTTQTVSRTILRCPSTRAPFGSNGVAPTGDTIWTVDYGFNLAFAFNDSGSFRGVMGLGWPGWSPTFQSPWFELSRTRIPQNPSTIYIAENWGRVWNQPTWWYDWTQPQSGLSFDNAPAASYPTPRVSHNKNMNVLFFDGHVESRNPLTLGTWVPAGANNWTLSVGTRPDPWSGLY